MHTQEDNLDITGKLDSMLRHHLT